MLYFDRETFAFVAAHAGGRRRVRRSAPRKTVTHALGRSAGATPLTQSEE
jgi:hypothetical protein